MRVAWLLLLLIPSAGAVDLAWQGIDMADAGEPIHLAVVAWDDGELASHVDMTVTATLDGRLLFQTREVHEHDGLHPMLIAPPGPGVLVVTAQTTDGAVANKTIIVNATGPAPEYDLRYHENRSLRVVPNEAPFGGSHQVATVSTEDDSYCCPTMGALLDVRDPQGRLIVSGWSNVHWDFSMPIDGRMGPGTVRAMLGEDDHHANPDGTLPLRTLEAQLPARDGDVLDALPGTGLVAGQTCDQSGHLVTDPNSLSSDGLVWQQWTDVRIAFLDLPWKPGFEEVSRIWPGGASVYLLEEGGSIRNEDAFFTARVNDPFGQVTFRTPGPGRYEIHYWTEGGGGCRVPFEVVATTTTDPESLLPMPEAPPAGRLETAVEVDNDTVEATFDAVGDHGALGHYEFDTRVIRTSAPAAMVWQGKLHGHDGSASFRLGALVPGDYEIHVYPSPQDQGMPPIATSDPAGFVERFAVEAAEEGQAKEPTQSTPWPATLLVGALAVAAGVSRAAAPHVPDRGRSPLRPERRR